MTHPIDEYIATLTAERDRLRAVNAKLLEACKMLLGSVECEHGYDDEPEAQPRATPSDYFDVHGMIMKARVAIAAAEELQRGTEAVQDNARLQELKRLAEGQAQTRAEFRDERYQG